jgi:hypothetical protein
MVSSDTYELGTTWLLRQMRRVVQEAAAQLAEPAGIIRGVLLPALPHITPADAKVCNLCSPACLQQHVLRLEVPVHHCRVQVGQATCNVKPNLQHLLHAAASAARALSSWPTHSVIEKRYMLGWKPTTIKPH